MTLSESITGAIPAWAGEPPNNPGFRRAEWGHPRVGGGTSVRKHGLKFQEGPSPRGRGNQKLEVDRSRFGGAIPAWAGEPFRDVAAEPVHGGHPRVGGGTGCRGAALIGDEGPSPRGRGNLGGDHAAGEFCGAIPAWAGEPVIP